MRHRIELPAAAQTVVDAYDPQSGCYRRPDGTLDYCPTEIEVLRLWYNLALMVRPKVIVETGVYHGLSTCHLAAALRDGRGGIVHAIDPWQTEHYWTASDLEPFIHYLPHSSQDAFPSLAHEKIDMLVIDSEHTYRQAIWELTHFEPLLVAGGYLLMHDTLYYDGLGRAVEQLHQSGRFESVSLDTPRGVDDFNGHGRISPGLTVARKIRSGPALVVDPRWVERPEAPPVFSVSFLRRSRSIASTPWPYRMWQHMVRRLSM
jgi:hypothetical protein